MNSQSRENSPNSPDSEDSLIYSFLKQNVIFSFLNEFEIFFSIDFIKSFFQQKIKSKNKWKTTFVTFYQNLKWLTVSSMKFDNTSDFFQNKMKKMFKIYLWKFVLIYMNNIIVYFKNKNQHLTHLKKMLNLFKKSDVILTLKKSHFAYFNIKILKHHCRYHTVFSLARPRDFVTKRGINRTRSQISHE